MSSRFTAMSIEDRKLAFDNAALTLHLNAVILEKDFWVSWLLRLLFAQPELAPFLVFKGGTSLAKVFGVIDRFSEDIDLCLVPEFVGADAQGFDTLTSRGKRDAAVLEMQRLCADKVQLVGSRIFRTWAMVMSQPDRIWVQPSASNLIFVRVPRLF